MSGVAGGEVAMGRIIDTEHARPALAAMLGCCDVDGGATAEQRAIIGALASGYFRVPFDADSAATSGPAGAAAAFSDPHQRRRLLQLLVFVEQCRHPLTEAQVERTEHYAAALGLADESLSLTRDLLREGTEAAKQDYLRTLGHVEPGLREPSLAGAPGSTPTTRDPELAARLEALHGCAAGTLGRAYVDFYDRYGFALPGTSDQPAALFVAHDMAHVIAGYEPDGVGEIALGAMQLAMTDSDEHWVQFLGNLAVHEIGYIGDGVADPALGRSGAVEAVAHAFDRGARCSVDFSLVDHLSMVDEPLEAVRSRFGVPAREC